MILTGACLEDLSYEEGSEGEEAGESPEEVDAAESVDLEGILQIVYAFEVSFPPSFQIHKPHPEKLPTEKLAIRLHSQEASNMSKSSSNYRD